MFTQQQLQTIIDLIIAGGKSPATGGEGMMAAAQSIALIKANEERLIAKPAEASGAIPLKPAA